MTWTHTFAWGNNPKRALLKGQCCRILAAGKLASVMIELGSGAREIVSRRALRKIAGSPASRGDTA